MSAYYGAEIATNMIIAHLRAGMPAALAAVRTERNDPVVTTEPPREYFIYPTANVYRPPAVFTIFERQEIKNINSDGNHINATDYIVVAVVVEDFKETLLTIKAFRYQVALMQLLHLVTLTNSDGGLRLFSKVETCEFSAIENLKGKAGDLIFRKEIGLRLAVDHIENLE